MQTFRWKGAVPIVIILFPSQLPAQCHDLGTVRYIWWQRWDIFAAEISGDPRYGSQTERRSKRHMWHVPFRPTIHNVGKCFMSISLFQKSSPANKKILYETCSFLLYYTVCMIVLCPNTILCILSMVTVHTGTGDVCWSTKVTGSETALLLVMGRNPPFFALQEI